MVEEAVAILDNELVELYLTPFSLIICSLVLSTIIEKTFKQIFKQKNAPKKKPTSLSLY